MQKVTQQNSKLLAEKSGWEAIETPNNVDGWTMTFRKPGRAVIRVRFSETGILTGLNAVDFVTGITANPTRDKGTRLSYYITEGII